ncbi:MAG TPA: cyclase family protein [Bacillota bacterium]|nr:cyclase family protein [Bacillota bacterium]
MRRLIDLSQMIVDQMPVYPGDTPTSLIQTKFIQSDGYNNHRLEIGMHAGTHIDGPMHMTNSEEYISGLPLETFIGEGIVLDVRNQPVIRMKPEYEQLIKPEIIVLLYTGLDQLYGSRAYYNEHPVVEVDFCRFLVEKKTKMLGVDLPSPDRYPFLVHQILLENKILILENLTHLEQLLGAESFEVIAFPLKIKADGSMVRAVARIG